MHKKLNILGVAITLLLFCSCLDCQAQEERGFNVDSYFRYILSDRAEGQSGKVQIMEADAEFSHEFRAFDRLPLKFSLGNKYIGIENTTNVELPAKLVGLNADIETTLPFFDFNDTYIRLGISPSFYGEDWSFPTSSFRIPSRAFLIYKPHGEWTFLFGVAVSPDFSIEVVPILGFIYKPNEKLTFNFIPNRPNISYRLNDRITVFTEGGASFNSEFEVAKDDSKNVVLCYRELHLGLGIKYEVNKFIQSSLSTGWMLNRSLEYQDNLGKVNIKDGAFIELRAEISF